MPLEISEIGVRLAVGNSTTASGGGNTAGTGDGSGGARELTPLQMDELVDRCVRKVLLALRTREAR